ncbi:MAG: AAA family ATPase, partial [Cyanobacteria bacterium J06632_22]
MLAIAGYDLQELIYQGSRSLIHRAVRQSDGQTVTLKTLATQYPTLDAIATLKHEHDILSRLSIAGVISAVTWQGTAPALVLENFQGLSLREFIRQQQVVSVENFLPIALRLAEILDPLHQAQIIHRDIKPSNILLSPDTREVCLIDFGLASELTEGDSAQPQQLTGTYAYMSPEQTGRMNRAVDYRTDLYSLGVTFYQMLSGKLPFQAKDALAWVHCHIAKPPPFLTSVNPKVPEVLAQIVAKLLAKMAEDRYQRAAGLAADLRTCIAQLTTGELSAQSLTGFKIGQRDRSGQFQLPQTLYGRDREVSRLLETFARAAQGTAELMLVSGYSGVGKSALVKEIHRPIVQQRGYFITGKFDQFRRNVPYESVIQAFQGLIQQLLSEPAHQLARWQQQLQDSLGSNGQVLVEVIPELELIIGPQPPVPDVTPAESQVRFIQTFQKLVNVFAQVQHPLVIFLDDLQWVDRASLDLIKQLLTETDRRHMLLIGAYRDNEVDPGHPLLL